MCLFGGLQMCWILFAAVCLRSIAGRTMSSSAPAVHSQKVSNSEPLRPPGCSPFVYVGSPADNLFSFHDLNMHPNPCIRAQECVLSATGSFLQDTAGLQIYADVKRHFATEVVTILNIEDDFCNDWGDIVQDGILQCPPKMGDASISSSWLSIFTENPYDREEEYKLTLNIRVMAGERIVFHIEGDILIPSLYP